MLIMTILLLVVKKKSETIYKFNNVKLAKPTCHIHIIDP